jgi:hypothetical protein
MLSFAGPLVLLADPLLDMRIAAWMATPDDKRLKDDNATSLRASDNAYTVEALLRWGLRGAGRVLHEVECSLGGCPVACGPVAVQAQEGM